MTMKKNDKFLTQEEVDRALGIKPEDLEDLSDVDLEDEFIEAVIRQIAGSMAIDGLILTEEDKDRIRKIPRMSREEIDAEVLHLVEKHTQK